MQTTDNIVTPSDNDEFRDTNSLTSGNEMIELREEAIANFQKPNLPNINIPERIIICLDVCCNNENSLYRLGDGTTFTPINMLKRVLDFFIYSKNAINNETKFALILLKDASAYFVHNFRNDVKDIIKVLDLVNVEESSSEVFDFKHVFDIVKREIEIPEYRQTECMNPPPYIVRMIVLYGRSNCMPLIENDDTFLKFLKKQMYFYIDILFAHEDECNNYKCEDIYDALQNLDNGYSYVYEVSRNAAKIHEYTAKLLAHPLQRLLQKNTDYTFGSRQ